MKHSILLMIAGVVLCCVCLLQLYYIREKPFELRSQHTLPGNQISNDRESITFILGDDNNAKNAYYREASLFYTENEAGRTDYIVSTCRSLLEVRDYLEDHTPCNRKPWGLINLVSHGNQWVGLSVKVTPNSRRTTSQRLLQCVEDGSFKSLPDSVVDEESEIFLHGCGLGNNPELLRSTALAFGGIDTQPVVRASRYFEYYSSSRGPGNFINSQRYLAKAWFTHYKYGQRPTKDVLSIEFRDKYPESSVNWIEALLREAPRFAGDYYHYSFEVPLKVVLPLPDDISVLFSEEQRVAYITSHMKVRAMLTETGIPAESFSWSAQRIYVDNEEGRRSPGILVKGSCTVVAIVKALSEGNGGRPIQPLFTDGKYYSATCVRQN